MSRGLGWVERAVLDYLLLDLGCIDCPKNEECQLSAEEKNWNRHGRRGEAVVRELCCYAEGLAECSHKEDWLEHMDDYSDARYKSVLRAVKSLERKGYVETSMETISFENYGQRHLRVELVDEDINA